MNPEIMTEGKTPTNDPQRISRREFLKKAALAAAGGALAACAPKETATKEAPPTQTLELTKTPEKPTLTPTPTETKPKSEFEVRLGEEENVNPPGLAWVPDTQITTLKDPTTGKTKLWLTAGVRSYLLEGDSLSNLGEPKLVLQAKNTQSEKGFYGYAGLCQVLPSDQSDELIGVCHQEHWLSQGDHFFTANIGITKSNDGGQTWGEIKTIMEGMAPLYPPPADHSRVSGAGQPNAILMEDNQVYLYFVDWNGQGDTIHLAKTRLDLVDKPHAWQRWDGQKFGRMGSEAESVPIIKPPALYASLPSISQNNYLNKLSMTFESNDGFYLATSDDGINWEEPKRIFDFPQPQFPAKPGQTWYSYPTFLSEDTDSDRETGQTGWLYYSKGVRGGQPHQMVRRSLTLK